MKRARRAMGSPRNDDRAIRRRARRERTEIDSGGRRMGSRDARSGKKGWAHVEQPNPRVDHPGTLPRKCDQERHPNDLLVELMSVLEIGVVP
jgi:hypothetical protein